ncbi:saccharopine dehydrogenase-like oxidoreductase [Sitodiplosis mosellana]|uniref:saccharopine dehydrogenase-like oxidoreductase n=1 Tax=Sitodiplosis mosellana TaxID=263140 RepID=UPI00244464C8|nr:saccharopine dehydrogenase-like oxidoreductase [Sitodiplosis mosellana]XP_055325411.1 saccharopine dehydrogenase-like oxidoreductase [Sitodiplosis mosellana]XP_055325413.1 saccharopine dehydrogenase-like oxidoreductase [Sitodiplosis mosellana]
MANNRLDVVIFGASGFTGKYTVYEGVKLLENLSWGVAGRDEEKLKRTLKEVGDKVEKDLSAIPIIIADVKDENSLQKMAERAKIIVNCCGPYRFYGEPVVKACINAGTHHVDVSGEPQFMERMQLEYNDLAREKGVYIVSACGFDSIPADMGMMFLEKHFDGEVHSVETYLKSWAVGPTSGAGIHYGTWESAVYGLAHAKELSAIRKKLFKEPLPYSKPKQIKRPAVHKSDLVNAWCLPFLGSDRSVVLRSQRFLYEHEQKRPIQMQAYVQFKSLLTVLMVSFMGIIFGILAKYSFGRKLLLKYPKLFSLGFISHEGPSEESMKNTKFSVTFYGQGWPKEEALSEPTDQHTTLPSKKIVTRVTGTNPGYGSTCIALLLAATTILNEKEKLPLTGGVLPPGACFAKTNYISNLSKNGLDFEVISATETSEN